MNPFRFIKLHDRNGNTEVSVNVEQIVTIRDLRSDSAVKELGCYEWTLVTTTSNFLEVVETQSEIFNLIAQLA